MVCGLLIQNIQEWPEQTGQSQEHRGHRSQRADTSQSDLQQQSQTENLLHCVNLKEKQKLHCLKNQEAHKSIPNAGRI